MLMITMLNVKQINILRLMTLMMMAAMVDEWIQVTGAGRQRPSVAGARSQPPDYHHDDADDDDADDADDDDFLYIIGAVCLCVTKVIIFVFKGFGNFFCF